MKGLLAVIAKKQSTKQFISEKLHYGLASLLHRGKHQHCILLPQNEMNSNIGLGVTSDNTQAEASIFTNDSISLVFAGKILNRKHLIATYPEINDSSSDEELIADLYLQLGEIAFSLWEGYGSIILIDKKIEKIYAVRDFTGTSPLFFFQSEDFLVFSSEIRPIYTIFPEQIHIKQEAVVSYLLWGDIMKHQQDFFVEIEAVAPSNFIAYSRTKKEILHKQYFRLPYKSCVGRYNEYDEKIIVAKTKDLFFNAMENHIAGKTQLAVGLSGGLDSSAIACTVKAINKEIPLTVFTAVNDINQGETLWAEKIVRHTDAEWIKVNCTSQTLIDDCKRIVDCQGIPVFNTSSLAQYKVIEAVSQAGFESMIDGQGSDELFGGYNHYYSLMLNELFSEWMFKDGMRLTKNLSNADLSLRTILKVLLKDFVKRNLLKEKHFAFLKRKEIIASLSSDRVNAYFRRKKNRMPIKENFNEYLYEDFTFYLSFLLRWGEHSAANFGIDCLTPFADSRALAQHVFETPSIYKLHKGWSKYILREAMKGVVPEEVLLRKQKVGFYTPENKWLEQIADEMKAYLHNLPDKDNVINKEHLFLIWDKQFAADNIVFKQFAFRCMNYLIWRNSLG